MTTLTVTLTNICAGGEHLTFSVTGDRTAIVQGFRDNMVEPISDEDAQAFVKILAKMARAGRTANQARILLQNGVTVEV